MYAKKKIANLRQNFVSDSRLECREFRFETPNLICSLLNLHRSGLNLINVVRLVSSNRAFVLCYKKVLLFSITLKNLKKLPEEFRVIRMRVKISGTVSALGNAISFELLHNWKHIIGLSNITAPLVTTKLCLKYEIF